MESFSAAGSQGNPNLTGIFDSFSCNYYRETFCYWEQRSVSGRSWRVSKEFVCPFIITVNRFCAFLLYLMTLLTKEQGGPWANQEPLASSTLMHVSPLLRHALGERWMASGGLFFMGGVTSFHFSHQISMNQFLKFFLIGKLGILEHLFFFFFPSCDCVFFTIFLIHGISKCEYVHVYIFTFTL